MNAYMDILEQFQNEYKNNGYPFDHENYPDPNFDKFQWIKIPINLQSKNPNLLPFVIAISETLRFEIGFTQPQYMLSKEHILSRRIEQDEEVGQFRIRTLYAYWKRFLTDERLYWEGMGRVVLNKYIYQDNDFNLYNALIDKNNYFIAIDADKAFWSVTEKYHLFRDIKIQRYNNTPYIVTDFKTPDGRLAYQIPGKKRSYIGEMHAEDYDTLPLIKHYHPTDWFFLNPEIKKYSTELSQDQRFLNEKYFSTVKAIVTENIKHLLIDIHIAIKQDRKITHQFIKTQLQKLTKIAKQNDAFKKYLQQNKYNLMPAIIHETKNFLNDKNYKISYFELHQSIIKTICDDIVLQYNKLLETFGHSQIQFHEVSLPDLKQFYKNQLMEHHAAQINLQTNTNAA